MAVEFAAAEQSLAETAHVGGGRGDSARAHRIENLKSYGILRRGPAIPFRGERLEFFGRRLEERGMRHTERSKDAVGDVLFKPLPADALDDIATETDAVVGISRNDARWKKSAWLITDEEVAQRGDLVGRLLAVHQNDVANGFFEAPGMRHQVSNGDGAAKRGANLKVEILIDIG